MDGTARSISYQYDARGNRTFLQASSGHTLLYTYDALDRMTALRESGPVTMVAFSYDNAARRSQLAFGPGTTSSTTSYGYDGVSRLTALTHDLAGTTNDQSQTFGYNAASQITSRTNSNDAYASNTAYAVNRNYSVNGLNQYTAAGSATFAYDANGSLISDGSRTFTYDAENRLVAASGGVTLAYDPLGRLWQVATATSTTRFVYDGDRLLEEYDSAGVRTRGYAWGPNPDEPLIWYQLDGAPVRRFLHADHQGSIVSAVDDVGNPVAINGYDAWGIPNAGNAGRFQYTGQAWLAELGMYYYKARIYSPTLGRFMQTDPIGYQGGLNLYAYVENDPVDNTDPTGNDCDSAKGQTTCKTDNYIVRFPTTPGWHDFTSATPDYHFYTKDANSPLDAATTQRWVQENPTPGALPMPASRGGTLNDATPVIGGLVRPMVSPVASFLTTNERSGRNVVVKVTLPGHQLKDGIVVRETVPAANGRSVIHNWGEGTSSWQRPGTRIGDMINNVWRSEHPDPCIPGIYGCYR